MIDFLLDLFGFGGMRTKPLSEAQQVKGEMRGGCARSPLPEPLASLMSNKRLSKRALRPYVETWYKIM